MVRRSNPAVLVLALAGTLGCGARDRLAGLVERLSGEDEVAVAPAEGETPTTTIEVAPASDAQTAAASVPTGPAAATAPAVPLDELELRDVQIEWVERSGWGYYGTATATQTLRIEGTGKLRAAVASDSNITVKAVCGSDPKPVADADVATIRGGYLDPLPAAPEEFPVRVDLFQTMQPTKPVSCRVQFILIDNKATPPRRGVVELCWRRGSKAAAPCAKEDELPPHAEVRDDWGIDEAEFAASGELLFSVIAGRTRAPDRIALRTTCYMADKRYVDFDFLVGRWYALAPGEAVRQRLGMTDLSDLLRFTECDLAFQDAGYDFEKFALRGTKDIQHLCVRPTGLVRGACRIEASESKTWDPTTPPAKIEYTHSGAHAYHGMMNAYMNGDLTVLAGLPKDAKVEVVARCGKREARQTVTIPIGLELVWPGQSVRVWSGASLAAKSTNGCELETVLAAIGPDGKPTTWSLARTCFDKMGSGLTCPK